MNFSIGQKLTFKGNNTACTVEHIDPNPGGIDPTARVVVLLKTGVLQSVPQSLADKFLTTDPPISGKTPGRVSVLK